MSEMTSARKKILENIESNTLWAKKNFDKWPIEKIALNTFKLIEDLEWVAKELVKVWSQKGGLNERNRKERRSKKKRA